MKKASSSSTWPRVGGSQAKELWWAKSKRLGCFWILCPLALIGRRLNVLRKFWTVLCGKNCLPLCDVDGWESRAIYVKGSVSYHCSILLPCDA